MAQRHRVDDRDSDTEATFSLLAEVTPPFETSRFERLWASLCNQYGDSR